MFLFQCILTLAVSFVFVETSKILGVFPSPGYSQFLLCEKLMKELVKKGHDVTVISAYKPKDEIGNYKTVLVDGILEDVSGFRFEEDLNIFARDILFHNFCIFMSEYFLSNSDVQKLIRSNETFDLVIVEQFGNEAHMGFAQHFNAPLVTFSSIGLSEWNSHSVGNIRPSSIVPLTITSFSNRMHFLQRMVNSLVNLFDLVYKETVHFPQQQDLLTKYFPKPMNLRKVMTNVSVMLTNSHFSITGPTMLTSSVVEIGGFHISKNELPGDIHNFLDEAEHGALFFSMGTYVKLGNISESKMDAIIKVIAKLKQRVLLKSDVHISNKPDNLYLSKWLPQSDILGHPNIVGFVTHGGISSTIEAIYHGVPMVGIPVFGDQYMNVARSVDKGISVAIPFHEFSEEKLYKAIVKVITNARYKEKSVKNSKFFRDRVTEPMDLAMYWIEYILKHGHADHLKNPSLELHWFQLYLFDVLLFSLAAAGLLFLLIKIALKKFFARN